MAFCPLRRNGFYTFSAVCPLNWLRTIFPALLQKNADLLIRFSLIFGWGRHQQCSQCVGQFWRLAKLFHQGGLQVQCGGSRFLWFFRGANRTQIGIGIEGALKLLGVGLPIIVRNIVHRPSSPYQPAECPVSPCVALISPWFNFGL